MLRIYQILCLLLILSGNAWSQSPAADSTTIKLYGNHYCPPMFRYGADSLKAYTRKHTRYPDAARENYVQGRVIVRFMVDEHGAISHVTIPRGIGAGCDEEALRMVRAMPSWTPATYKNKPVKAYATLPVIFTLQ